VDIPIFHKNFSGTFGKLFLFIYMKITKQQLRSLLKESIYGKPTAMIITGNPKYLAMHQQEADKFYSDIAYFLMNMGYEVHYDPGEPYTTPPSADIWVGHSRGIGRLRFAPEGTKTIAFGGRTRTDDIWQTINHPEDERKLLDHVAVHGTSRGFYPGPEHYVFTKDMEQALFDLNLS